METALGVILTTLGGIGLILGPALGFSDLVSPWSFISGFSFGVMAGVGIALLLGGFLNVKKGG